MLWKRCGRYELCYKVIYIHDERVNVDIVFGGEAKVRKLQLEEQTRKDRERRNLHRNLI